MTECILWHVGVPNNLFFSFVRIKRVALDSRAQRQLGHLGREGVKSPELVHRLAAAVVSCS